MGAFTTSQIVILPFPFSNLLQNKYRPALLLANVGQGDWLVSCYNLSPILIRNGIYPAIGRYGL